MQPTQAKSVRWALVVTVLACASAAGGPLDAVAAYRERSAVIEALSFASDAKLAVAEFYLDHERLPRDTAELRWPASRLASPGIGVESLRVDGGTILITLGGEAPSSIHGKALAISPCLEPDGALPQFTCGFAVCPGETLVMHGAPQSFALTTLTQEQLPASCRGVGVGIPIALQMAKDGHLEAQAHWGGTLIRGRELPRDVPEGLRILRGAAERGGGLAQAMLADYYALGIPGHLEIDDVSAYYWFARSIDSNGPPVAAAAKLELERRMTPAQLAEARERVASSRD